MAIAPTHAGTSRRFAGLTVQKFRGKGVFVRIILAAWFVLVFCASVFAQSPTGSIGGIVFDTDARTIPGAEIIAVSDLTRVQYESRTLF
jgi:hypothetical protein